MSRTVGPKGQTMRATVDPRRRTARVPSTAPDEYRAAPAAPAFEATLEAWKAEAFALLADDEGRAIGKPVYTQAERHNARRRRDRAAEGLVSTPDGRAAMHDAAAHVAGTRSVARMFARVGVDFRPAVADGFRLGTQAIAEHGVRSRTGATFALGHGLLFAVGLHLQAEAAEAGTRIMGMSKSTTEKGVKATAALSGFRDLQQLSLACLSKAAVLFEMMMRAESDARVVEKERRLVGQARAWAERRAAEEKELRDRALSSATTVEEDACARAPDAEDAPLQDTSTMDNVMDPAGSVAEHEDDAAGAVLREQAWCAVRQRTVPASIANTPRPSAASGPDWVERLREEDAAIAAFDEALRRARSSAARRKN